MPAGWRPGAILVAALPATVCVSATWLLWSAQGSVTLGDILGIAAVISLLSVALQSMCRDPMQFSQAIWERAVYVTLVPFSLAIVVGLFLLSIAFILFRLSFKAIVVLAVWLIYLVFPVDLIPDFVPVLGQIDDALVLISLCIWIISASARRALFKTMQLRRPKTPFP
jgi:hypothetical protein